MTFERRRDRKQERTGENGREAEERTGVPCTNFAFYFLYSYILGVLLFIIFIRLVPDVVVSIYILPCSLVIQNSYASRDGYTCDCAGRKKKLRKNYVVTSCLCQYVTRQTVAPPFSLSSHFSCFLLLTSPSRLSSQPVTRKPTTLFDNSVFVALLISTNRKTAQNQIA